MITKKKFKIYFVLINTTDFSVKVTYRVSVASKITNASINSLKGITSRHVINDWLICRVTEE